MVRSVASSFMLLDDLPIYTVRSSRAVVHQASWLKPSEARGRSMDM